MRGYDGAKKIKGRKRYLAVDTLGLLLAVVVTSAGTDDAAAAPQVLQQLHCQDYPRLEVAWADSKYHHHRPNHGKSRKRNLPWRLEIVGRPPGTKGFVLLPRRWVVERTFAWLGRSRRLSKDYEPKTQSSEAIIQLSAMHHILKRFEPETTYPPFNYHLAAQTAFSDSL